jgi:hypothetical protein
MEFDRYLNAALDNKSGREALVGMAEMYRQFAGDHPGIYPLILRAPAPDEEEFAAITSKSLNTIMLVFSSFGITGDEALHGIRGFRSLLHGFISLEQVGGFGLPLDLDESYALLTNMIIDGFETLLIP